MDTLSLLLEALDPIQDQHVLDIGCGPGYLSHALTKYGARVTGVDPAADAVAVARMAVPSGTFKQARGEELPFEDGSFSAAVLLNALHHIPEELMGAALREAARVVEAGGQVIVIEPLASGSFFAVLRSIEDETQAREAAQAAVRQAVASGDLTLVREVEYVRHDTFARFDDFAVRVCSANRAREAVLAARRGEIEAAFKAAATRVDKKRFALEQPLRAQLLAPRSA